MTPSASDHPRVLYVFGDPVDATASVLARTQRDGRGWLKLHALHLRAEAATEEDLIHKDGLKIQDHLRAWSSQSFYTTAFVRYETMWQNVAAVSDFLGLPLVLPAERPRRSESLQADRAALEKTYSEAARYVDSLPNFFVRRAAKQPRSVT